MNSIDDKNPRKVTLDIDDLVDMVSKRKGSPISEAPPSRHSIEGEELKKAWFNHMLISMEKISDQIQDIRKTDLAGLKAEFKEELRNLEEKINKIQDNINVKIDKTQSDFNIKIASGQEDLKSHKKDVALYNKEVVAPINLKLATLVAKLGVWSVIAGFIGSGLMAILIFIIQKYVFV